MQNDCDQIPKVYQIMALIATVDPEKIDVFVPEFTKGLNYLEQLTATRAICDDLQAPYLYQLDPKSRSIKYVKGRCKKWSCPECAISNVKQWIGRIIDGCNNLTPDTWYLATITAHRKWRKEKSLINIRSNWPKLRKRLARQVKKQAEDLFYCRVWEHHKDGSYHMHLITNAAITTKWLKDNAAQCGLGYQAKMGKPINAGQAAGYVAKYMLKQSADDTLRTYPKGARRIECSQNWVAWKSNETEIWRFAGQFHEALAHSNLYKFQGYKVWDALIQQTKRRI